MRKGILLQIVSLGAAASYDQHCDPAIEELLSEFASVFATPSGLPPCRGHEHQILLKEGTKLPLGLMMDIMSSWLCPLG